MSFVKSSTGRDTRSAKPVRDVEALECPAAPRTTPQAGRNKRVPPYSGGMHELTNGGGITYCIHCGREWSELDEEARR